MSKHPNFDAQKDRLRYTKNTSSATQAYVAILFNVLYFVSIYEKDVGNYFYNITIGFSVVCNLLFLLGAFLFSEGVKNYKLGYCIAFIPLGLFQLLRIISIPMDAYNYRFLFGGSITRIMDEKEFIFACVCLCFSAMACFATAITGIRKIKTLRDYEKSLEK